LKSKLKGVPLALLGIIGLIALAVDLPMVLLHKTTQDRLTAVENNQLNNTLQIQRVGKLLVTPTATPSATVSPTPTRGFSRPSVTVKPTISSPQVK
jgi:hypothetical protein